MTSVTILVDNHMSPPWEAEHGLALAIRHGEHHILFDTGSGTALLPNLRTAGLAVTDFTCLILSHGHYDHTGALADILPHFRGWVYHAPGCTGSHWSLHPGMPPRNIAMTAKDQEALLNYSRRKEIPGFTGIAPGIWLTGPIPRESGEDTGGPFFLDRDGKNADLIEDEQAMLLSDGTLIQGCCHAGIINPVRYCRKCVPHIPVKRIIGGLHLLHASPERLRETAEFLQAFDVTPLHCTGENAAALLRA